jgi:hypothetical protein
MTFTIPNFADAAFAPQAYPGSSDMEALTRGFAQTGVKTNCAVTAKAPAAMTVAVAAGTIYAAGTEVSVSGGDVSITAANATNPRRDLVVASSAGVKSAVTGSAGAVPVAPAIPANSIALAEVYVPANASVINSNQIIDKRVAIVVPTLTAAVLTAYKTADQSITNDNTLNDDADMHVPVIANGIYAFSFYVWYNLAASGTGPMRAAIDAPTGNTGYVTSMSLGTAITGASGNLGRAQAVLGLADGRMDMDTNAGTWKGAGWGSGVLINGANAGNLSFAWTNGTSESYALTLYKGSWLQATRLA